MDKEWTFVHIPGTNSDLVIEDGVVIAISVLSGEEVNPTAILGTLNDVNLTVNYTFSQEQFGISSAKLDKLTTMRNSSDTLLTEQDASSLVDNYAPSGRPIVIANCSNTNVVTLPQYSENNDLFLPIVNRVSYTIGGLPISCDNNPFRLTYNNVTYGLNSFISLGGANYQITGGVRIIKSCRRKWCPMFYRKRKNFDI